MADAVDAAPGLVLREAGPDDADAVGALHAAGWRHAYRGIMPDAFLDEHAVDERQSRWRAKFADDEPGRVVLLAEAEGAPVGFGTLLGEPETAPERGRLIDNLHVLPAWHGHGVGSALLFELVRRADGRAHLWVLDGNVAAEGFYRARGFRPDIGEVHEVASGGTHPARLWRIG